MTRFYNGRDVSPKYHFELCHCDVYDHDRNVSLLSIFLSLQFWRQRVLLYFSFVSTTVIVIIIFWEVWKSVCLTIIKRINLLIRKTVGYIRSYLQFRLSNEGLKTLYSLACFVFTLPSFF